MIESTQPRCSNLEQSDFNTQKVAEDIWEAMLSAEVFTEGKFVFASGLNATLKADFEKIYSHPKQLEVILGHFASFPCVQDADVLLYVPDGMRQFITTLGEILEKSVAATIRRPQATSKYDFVFRTPEDEEMAISAERPMIGEDVVTTLGSVAALRRLLPAEQRVHSLAILLRGTVQEEYREGLVDHYLLTRKIPTDKYEFRRLLNEESI
jgi:orotate phosphoribosyltransferase